MNNQGESYFSNNFPLKSPTMMALVGELTGFRVTTGQKPGCVVVSQPVWRALAHDLCITSFAHWSTERKMALINSVGSVSLNLFRVPILLGYVSDKIETQTRNFCTLSVEQYARLLATKPQVLNS